MRADAASTAAMPVTMAPRFVTFFIIPPSLFATAGSLRPVENEPAVAPSGLSKARLTHRTIPLRYTRAHQHIRAKCLVKGIARFG